MTNILKHTAYKIFAMLLIFCMVAAPNAALVMAAGGVPVITGGTDSGRPGESVEVVFTMTDNPGLQFMGIDVIWDDRLTDVAITPGIALPNGTVVPGTGNQRRVNFFSFAGDVHDNGILLTVRATIASGTTAGTIPIRLHMFEINNAAQDLNPVAALNYGIITVEAVPGQGGPGESTDEGDDTPTDTPTDNQNNNQNNNQQGSNNQPGTGDTTPPPQDPVTPGTQLPPSFPDSGSYPDIVPDDISDPQSLEETGNPAVDQADDIAPLVSLQRRTVRFTMGSVVYTVNGVHFTNDVAPFIDSVHSRTMIPLRAVSEALGAEVEWICAERTVQIFTAAGMQTLAVDVPLPDGMGIPVIVQDRVFVPLYFVAKLLDAQVRWDGANNAAYVYM